MAQGSEGKVAPCGHDESTVRLEEGKQQPSPGGSAAPETAVLAASIEQPSSSAAPAADNIDTFLRPLGSGDGPGSPALTASDGQPSSGAAPAADGLDTFLRPPTPAVGSAADAIDTFISGDSAGVPLGEHPPPSALPPSYITTAGGAAAPPADLRPMPAAPRTASRPDRWAAAAAAACMACWHGALTHSAACHPFPCRSRLSAGSDPLLSYISSSLASRPRTASAASAAPSAGSSGLSAAGSGAIALHPEARQWELQWGDLAIERPIGAGSFG